jgi:hypothetical protein
MQCRDFLLAMQKHQHSVVMTKEIRAEWDKHQSRFALTWLRQMVAKKQFKAISPELDQEIWESIEAQAKTDNQRAEMTKDILLLAWVAEAPHSGVAECWDECTRVDDSGSD